jgi:hypothetical protein
LEQFCVVAVAVVPVNWQVPDAQFCVHVAPEPQVSWQLLFPLQLRVQVEPVQLPWHSPVEGHWSVQTPELQLHCWPAMQVMEPLLPPPVPLVPPAEPPPVPLVPPPAEPPPVPPVPEVPHARRRDAQQRTRTDFMTRTSKVGWSPNATAANGKACAVPSPETRHH